MVYPNILFVDGIAKTPLQVKKTISDFKYVDASCKTIRNSWNLQQDGKVFICCSSRILTNFGMTRSGVFKDLDKTHILDKCWEAIESDVLEIRNSVIESRLSRDRYLLEIDDDQREKLIAKIWLATKKLLPLTMGKT